MTLSDHTRAIRAEGRKALVAFLTAGYPDADTFMGLVRAADDAGCDVIEIGIPFSDPIADGPVIQHSSTEALALGVTLSQTLEMAGSLSSQIRAPLVFMSYTNPILSMGLQQFAERASNAGVRGLIVPDMSFEESPTIRDTIQERDIAFIDLLAPTSSDERIVRIAGAANGFVYLVSVTGVTGSRMAGAADLEGFVGRVRAHTTSPLYVGFGIATPQNARDTAGIADGVIIGSELIRRIDDATDVAGAVAGVESFLKDVRSAIDTTSTAQR